MGSDCSHTTSQQRDWLPSTNDLLKPHPYCQKCGTVKNVSSDRGKKLGYFVNAIHSMKDHLDKKNYKISQAQIRLVLKEFVSEDLDDEYSTPFSTQREGFIRITRNYLHVTEDTVKSFI